MTPFDCAAGIADFLRGLFADEDERADDEWDTDVKESVKVYAGFLPFVNTREAKKKLCPAVVVRPISARDETERSVASIAVLVTTYDEDETRGCMSMYHLAEFVRHALLSKNPAMRKFRIVKGSMESTFPDEQPYPQWWGRLDFDITIPQPENHEPINRWTGGA